MNRQFTEEIQAPYDEIADEYYDQHLHRTSRNFDAATEAVLKDVRWRQRIPQWGLVLDVGAGRGRCGEYLGIDPKRVVQLDSSSRMLALSPREDSLLRVHSRAEAIAFSDSQFSCVTAFLCDGFWGLQFLKEAFRLLSTAGIFVGTIPTHEWGAPLRSELNIDVGSTRFITKTRTVINVPSTLVTASRLREMLAVVGFSPNSVEVLPLTLPTAAGPISADIEISARKRGESPHTMPILYLFIANR